MSSAVMPLINHQCPIYINTNPVVRTDIEGVEAGFKINASFPLSRKLIRTTATNRATLTPIEVDMGMVYGLGFPPFRGGLMQYADSLGIKNLVEASKKYEGLGNLYKANEMTLGIANSGKTFYPEM